MNDIKYVIIDDCFPVVFSAAIPHKDVAIGLCSHGPVTSAGFLTDQGDHISAHGESVSLDIKSKPGDSRILTRFLKGN